MACKEKKYYTTDGTELVKYGNHEFAELMLSHEVGTVFIFLTNPEHVENRPDLTSAAVIVRPVESYSVYLNRLTPWGGAAFTFDISVYDMFSRGDKTVYDDMLEELMLNLSRYNISETWWVKQDFE